MTTDQLRETLTRLPRVPLAHLPTPLQPLPRLSEALGGVELWIKRDDNTGLALGGNKARQLEFTVGEALAQEADCLVQGAGSQSNHCRQAAAAAAKLGLQCRLLLHRDAWAEPAQGNLLLDTLFGAHITWTDTDLGHAFEDEKEKLANELRLQGMRPYVIGGERGKTLSAAGYVNQLCELFEQCREGAVSPDYVYLCTSGATHAGLALARKALGLAWQIRGLAPIVWDYDVPASIAATANRLALELGVNVEVRPEDLDQSDAFVGPGYGLLSREARVAIELVARTEGILLDPVYTGKAMAGLIDHVRRGKVSPGSRVIFIHTGGTPGLFCYPEAKAD